MSGSVRFVKKFQPILAISAVVLALGACSPIVDQRGYVPAAESLEQLSPGQDTRQTVARRLGSPSTLGTFENDVWYYISHREEQTAFYRPKITDRKVVAVIFNDAGTLDRVGRYGMEDGRVINLVSRETPTRGKELSILRELFGNIGRFNDALSNNPLGRVSDIQ